MDEPSVFTKIINGEIPSWKVYEDDRVIAFLNIRPVCDGHTLVVPKKQVDQIWDLDNDDYNYLWGITQKIAKHLREIMKVDRVGVVVKGFDVPHTHIHLIPVNFHSGIDFDPNPMPPEANHAKLTEVADRIRMQS